MSSGRRAGRVLGLVLAEAGSGSTAAAGAVLLAVAAFLGGVASTALFSRGWDDPLNTALTAVLLLAPLTAGTAVLRMQQVCRPEVAALLRTTPRGQRAAVLLSAAAVALWSLLAYGVTAGLLAVRAQVAGGFGVAEVLLVVLALSSLSAALLLGLAVGRHLSSRLAAPAVALVVFAWIYVISYSHSWVARLSPVYADSYFRSYLQPRVPVLAQQTVLAAALALGAALVALAHRRSRAAAALTGLPLAVGAVALVVLSRAGTDEVALRPSPQAPACRTAPTMTFTLCLWPVDRADVAPAARALGAVTAATRTAFDLPRRYTAPGIDDRRTAGRGVWVQPTGAPSEQSLLEAAAFAVTDQPRCSLDSAQGQAAQEAADLLRFWVLARTSGPQVLVQGPAVQEVTAQLQRPDHDQHAWTSGLLQRVQACL